MNSITVKNFNGKSVTYTEGQTVYVDIFNTATNCHGYQKCRIEQIVGGAKVELSDESNSRHTRDAWSLEAPLY